MLIFYLGVPVYYKPPEHIWQHLLAFYSLLFFFLIHLRDGRHPQSSLTLPLPSTVSHACFVEENALSGITSLL